VFSLFRLVFLRGVLETVYGFYLLVLAGRLTPQNSDKNHVQSDRLENSLGTT